MLTREQAYRTVTLVCGLDWSTYSGKPEWRELLGLVNLLQSYGQGSDPLTGAKLVEPVAVPRPLWIVALGWIKRHRDDCHMFRPDHMELCTLVDQLDKLTYGGGND